MLIDQGITGEAVANAPQDSTIDQSDDVVDAGARPAADAHRRRHRDVGDPLSGDLLNVDVDLAADLDLAAPIAGAVAANANVAAPIDAAVAANIGSIDSEATAVAQQDAIITQDIDARRRRRRPTSSPRSPSSRRSAPRGPSGPAPAIAVATASRGDRR